MRELALLREYMVQLRAEKLGQLHTSVAQATVAEGVIRASAYAHEVSLIDALLLALKELDSDQDEFVHRYLQR